MCKEATIEQLEQRQFEEQERWEKTREKLLYASEEKECECPMCNPKYKAIQDNVKKIVRRMSEK